MANDRYALQAAGGSRWVEGPLQVGYGQSASACYVIDRFDRDTPTKPASRLHTIDTTQWLNYDRSFKYQKANAGELKRAIEMTSTRALTRLSVFRWTVFNVLVGNADAHLKNLSFYTEPRGYRLAPIYDIVSTVVYHNPTHRPQHPDDHWPRCELTMPLGGDTRFSAVTRNSLIVFGTEIGLRPAPARMQLDAFLAPLDRRVEETLAEVRALALPDAGENRLLNSIVTMPIREMSNALRNG